MSDKIVWYHVKKEETNFHTMSIVFCDDLSQPIIYNLNINSKILALLIFR